MADVAIGVEGLSFAYGSIKAVDDISFTVAPGEVLGFLGPNGAGKSTTIKMLTGQLAPDTGSISILGRPMPAQREEIQARMGVCFEEKNLYDVDVGHREPSVLCPPLRHRRFRSATLAGAGRLGRSSRRPGLVILEGYAAATHGGSKPHQPARRALPG